MNARALLVLALAVAGCGDDDASRTDVGPADAGVPDAVVDAGLEDATTSDAVPGDSGTADAGLADVGGDVGFGMTCEGACARTRLEARFGDVTELFDAAYFGFNADGTLRLEVYGGAADGCPEMDSPTPDRTLIVGALPEPTDRNEVTLTASLLDFEGTLTMEPILRAPMAHVRPSAALLVPREMAFVRMDFDAAFDGGEVDGVIYATHCASLDE